MSPFNNPVDGSFDSPPESQNQNPLYKIQSLAEDNNNHVNERGGTGTYRFDNYRGRIVELAKDQHYSQVLQETMMVISGAEEEVSCIFLELIDHVIDLMLDTYGTYVIQKLVEICNEQQRTQIILKATQHYFHFFRICKSPHGYVSMYMCM